MGSFVLQGIIFHRDSAHLSKWSTGSSGKRRSLLVVVLVHLPSLGSLDVTWHSHFDVGSGWGGRWLELGVGELLGHLLLQVEQAMECWVVEHDAAAFLLLGTCHILTLPRLYLRVHGDHGPSVVSALPPLHLHQLIWSSINCIFRRIDALTGHLLAFKHLLHL